MRRRTSTTAPRGSRSTLALSAALMLATAALPLSRAQAQQQGHRGQQQRDALCGETADSSGVLDYLVEHYASVFADSDYADFRASLGIATMAADAPRAVVRDPRICARLRPLVLQQLRKFYPDPVRLADWDLLFFRFGDYYAVSTTPKLPPGMVVNGYSPVFIYRAATLEYVGLING